MDRNKIMNRDEIINQGESVIRNEIINRNKTINANEIMSRKWNTADRITLMRLAGTVFLMILQPFSPAFFCMYILTGLTDVLDGWIARKTNTASEFGARLDSMADLFFYAVIVCRCFPALGDTLTMDIWYGVAIIIILRAAAYGTAMVKYRQFAALHTYLNKLTGIAVFAVPFFLGTEYAVGYCRLVCVAAAAAALEELIIHLHRQKYRANTKAFLQKE
ncbi:MAG: CDP-alcohol phosphatidyltransferase family protein [Clostridiales bacterium]|nr:CDP-alcohol phosphatidyltransferase family protein [Clostridiales bacterium]